MDKKRIIFFGSGDFPRETFEFLIASMKYTVNCPYEIVGLVTSHDKCEDNGNKLAHIASESNILVAVCKDCNDEGLYDWCEDLNPDIFVVISFKKIPQKLLDLVNGNAFNIHASLLPLLRGANPIRWAIRHGMTETGLTAIELSNKIDCGNIIKNIVIPIDKEDNYGSLKKKMSEKCASFTDSILRLYVYNGSKPKIVQSNCGLGGEIFTAPKLSLEYYHIRYMEDLNTVLRSVLPYNGVRCRLVVTEKTPTTEMLIEYWYKTIEIYDCTIWGVHKAEQGEKTLIDIFHSNIMDRTYPLYIVDELQIQGKKRMTYNQFINGFKYLKDYKRDNEQYKVHIELY